jgi:hypothetical protein
VTLVDEHFEIWPPPGWLVSWGAYPGVLWKSSASCEKNRTNQTGGTGLFANADSDCIYYTWFDSTLITPEFSLADPAYTSAQVVFKECLRRWVSWYATAEVGITTDGGNTLITLVKYPELNFCPLTETIDLTPYLGQAHVRLGWRYQTLEVDYYWQVDDVQVIATKGAPAGRRAGDCNGDGTVSITELQQVVNNQLGISATGCGDCDGGGQVSITELQKAVNCQLGMQTCDTNCQH